MKIFELGIEKKECKNTILSEDLEGFKNELVLGARKKSARKFLIFARLTKTSIRFK